MIEFLEYASVGAIVLAVGFFCIWMLNEDDDADG